MTDNIFEEFLRRFSAVRAATHNNPRQIVNRYWDHKTIHGAVDALEELLYINDFDRTVTSSTKRQFGPVPTSFEVQWKEFKKDWLPYVLGYKNSGKRFRIKTKLPNGTVAQDNSPDDPPSVTPLSEEELAERDARNRSPDYEWEEDFDPFKLLLHFVKS